MWISTRAVKTNGSKKCKEKKRFKVGFSTQKLPQMNVTMSLPTQGIAESKFVITVAKLSKTKSPCFYVIAFLLR